MKHKTNTYKLYPLVFYQEHAQNIEYYRYFRMESMKAYTTPIGVKNWASP